MKQLVTGQIASGFTQYPQLASVPVLYRSNVKREYRQLNINLVCEAGIDFLTTEKPSFWTLQACVVGVSF